MSTSNKTHITISLDKEARDFYEVTAKALNIPLPTLLRLMLVANIGRVEPLTDLLKAKLTDLGAKKND